MDAAELNVDDHALRLTNLGKVLYPSACFTKADVIDYYIRVAPFLLPHLRDRPLTLKRYPEGVEAEYFYQKECPEHRPKWMKTAEVHLKEKTIQYCLVNDLASLVWTANLANLEFHPLLAKRQDVTRPTAVAFDLDPGAPANVVDCARVALQLRKLLARWDLDCYPKTSGSKGLQVYVPLNTTVTYEGTKSFAREVARELERTMRGRVTSVMSKELRVGRVFVDWSQNDEHKTTVSVYSLRGREQPTASTPMTWNEVEKGVRKGTAVAFAFLGRDVLGRVEKHGDLFGPVLKKRQRLPSLEIVRQKEPPRVS